MAEITISNDGTYPLHLVEGDSNSVSLVLLSGTTPVDLTGYTASAVIRRSYAADAALVADLEVSFTSPRTSGEITVSLDDVTSAALTEASGNEDERDVPLGVWRLRLTDPSGSKSTWLSGPAYLRRDVEDA